MYRVGRRHVKFRARNVSRHWNIDLPNGLFVEPLLGSIFRNFRSFCQFFDGGDPFSSPGSCSRFWLAWRPLFIRQKSLKETKSRVSKRERRCRRKEARPVSAARLADTCPGNSALWAETVSGRGGPGCRA